MNRKIGVVVTMVSGFTLAACSHHQAAPAPQPQEPAPVADNTPPAPAPAPAPAEAPPDLSRQSIYFDFDQALLSDSSREVLQNLWEAFKAHPDAKLRIEGNCDERGTEEYNLALGQQRATAAKEYLESLGANAGAISTVSYGKDHPAVQGHDEDAWAKNRRDDINPLK